MRVRRTLLYFLMFLTSSMKASSTLTLCFADVSMHVVPKCLASSRPSVDNEAKEDASVVCPSARHFCQSDPAASLSRDRPDQLPLSRFPFLRPPTSPHILPLPVPTRNRYAGLTMHADLPLVLQISLVGHHEDGEEVLVLDPEDLLVELRNLLERVPRGDGVDEQEAFSCAHIPVRRRGRQQSAKTGSCRMPDGGASRGGVCGEQEASVKVAEGKEARARMVWKLVLQGEREFGPTVRA